MKGVGRRRGTGRSDEIELTLFNTTVLFPPFRQEGEHLACHSASQY